MGGCALQCCNLSLHNLHKVLFHFSHDRELLHYFCWKTFQLANLYFCAELSLPTGRKGTLPSKAKEFLSPTYSLFVSNSTGPDKFVYNPERKSHELDMVPSHTEELLQWFQLLDTSR